MKKASLSFFLAGIATGVLLATLLGAFMLRSTNLKPTGERTIAIKLAHGLEESHPVHQAMIFMKQRLEELSNGRASLDVYSGGVLGNEVDCLEQVQKGELAMTKTSIAAMEAFLPEMKVFSIPFAFRDAEHFWNTLHSPVGKRILELGVKSKFRGLCYYDSGDRNFYTTKKAVNTVADLQGMKIRVMNSRSAMDMIRAMGGSPCPISWGELYTALSQGTVDAAENNPPSFISSRHYEVCKYFIKTGHQRIPDMLVINTGAWESLDPAIQRALQQAATESESFQRKLWQEVTDASLTQAAESGVEIITPDLTSFRQACESMLQDRAYQDIRALYAEIQEVK